MDILSLDLARVTGWARGVAGQQPRYGSVALRKPGEPNGLAPGALGRWLRDHVRAEGKPDMIVLEHWLPPTMQKSASIIEDGLRLNGACHAIAGVYGIEISEPYPATVRSQVCGKPHAGSREATKKMVIESLILRGVVPKGFKDDDAADALALFIWAASNFARIDGSFVLTGR